ncbi:2-C-methyl-D-erythritol 2,4-cyclodiphosphate synthase [Rhizobium sp. RU20A]|uniref:bifunctional 2-C-methyl-D-erythritol 4-phosphate cytidylyltransferase/2-C-methyl-D-erythritol 2,4-cyclodiphosphate synthase n=1 Tax=Rhizobium sp. RU20A TaxID=1907412 RepID=UPI000954A6C4|nr:bifunctional 2-C-methyl-D-erythritol 4-phosphate cytidylyltransferase/2-C-methyl-D-erythritol 2,4-cyclodiphosphate synthase [Rhizobium sp. RU20A]SIQ10408.1 2-C-methyl-D-erythritol 2,4-cyclodiphosphate synthase [Rhizobium sp. RU20A]
MTDDVISTGAAPKIGFVVVAAGRGERAGQSAEGPKQYRRIGDVPVIRRTLDVILAWPGTGAIVAVIHPDDGALMAAALASLSEAARARIILIHGGPTRQLSVLAGLDALAGTDITHAFIQDAVRPFIDEDLLDRCRAALIEGKAAVLPALPIAETIKRADPAGQVSETVARAGLYGAQTPQCFALTDILAAHRAAAASGRHDFTDDASIAEWHGLAVHLVTGSPDNVKLTVQRDIALADEKLTARAAAFPDVRTGNGYDVHQLVEGDGVTLCGVFIPHDRKLSGHSDADVALHALTDALLATCGAGDIGDHFPPSDPQWKGAASRIFLERAAEIVRERGGVITNADISIVAEAPKVGPHRLAMRENLSAFLGISLDRCSIKATTNETIGFVGRREGICAIATATVIYPGSAA